MYLLVIFCRKYGIEITNFGKSWRDGLAFNAMVHTINPDLVDFDECRKQTARNNLEQAFSVAESHLGIPRLLDPEGLSIIVEINFICLLLEVVKANHSQENGLHYITLG